MRRLANNIVIPEFSAWLTFVLERCRAENIRNLPRKRAPTPLFPERRPREACSMPISGCHDLPLATFNLPSRNNLQNKPNSAATMSLPCSRFATAQPQRRWDAPPSKQHRHSGIFRVADLGPGTMPRGKYPESPAPRPYFQNADPGRHAPCQSRAATTSPSQLSTSPPATTSKTNPTAPPQCPSRAVASRQRSRNAGGMRRLAAEIPDIFDSDVFPAGDSFTGSTAALMLPFGTVLAYSAYDRPPWIC